MLTAEKSNLGGARSGAGRKRGSSIYGVKLKPMRVPDGMQADIHQFIIGKLGIPDPYDKPGQPSQTEGESHDGDR